MESENSKWNDVIKIQGYTDEQIRTSEPSRNGQCKFTDRELYREQTKRFD